MAASSQQRIDPVIPSVRIEVRQGHARPIAFDIDGPEFLVGSVPGCDLRLPGTHLPPNVCLFRRGIEGVTVRRLAPSFPILVNGQPVPPAGRADIQHGDRVSIGDVELAISVAYSVAGTDATVFPKPTEEPPPFADDEPAQHAVLVPLPLPLPAPARYAAPVEPSGPFSNDPNIGIASLQELRGTEFERILREELEREFRDRYQERNEELDRMQLAVREAAVQLRERKQTFEESLKNIDPRIRELADKEADFARRLQVIDSREGELRRRLETHEADRRIVEIRHLQREEDLARREVDLAAREVKSRQIIEENERELERYRADLVRVDRLSAVLESRERALDRRIEEVEHRAEQMRTDAADFEEHLRLFDEREERVKIEEAALLQQRESLDAREHSINERQSAVETQQASLAALRTRLEHQRDELQQESQRLTDERQRIEDDSRKADQRLEQVESVRRETEEERDIHAESYRLFQERSGLIQEAIERLRGMQDQLSAEDERLKALASELESAAADRAEEAGLLRARAEQLAESAERLDADRSALKLRESTLREAEQARDTLQEQLRIRSEELTRRQRELDERSAAVDEQDRQLAVLRAELEARQSEAADQRRLTDDEWTVITERDEKLRQAESLINRQQTEMEESRRRFEAEQADGRQRWEAARREIDELKAALSADTAQLLSHIPQLESRAQSTIERMSAAREGVRSQLTELHSYAVKSQRELEGVREQIRREFDELRRQEQGLQKSRNEHRLAVASFRQQLIEWQSRFTEMKQALHAGESRIDRRGKLIEAGERKLAEQIESLQHQESEVTAKREEVDRHISDMRDWYRRKFREVAEARWSKHHGRRDDDPTIIPMPNRSAASDDVPDSVPVKALPDSDATNPLPISDELDPADRDLGELLRSLGLVDSETIDGLWMEARRQRRTLRQILMAGGFLTLYQLALIESGNVDKLMLGRFRVIDRLLATPRESVYRVFDPQRSMHDGDGHHRREEGTMCLLRHLGEAEMLDAVRPDEYRMRFGAVRDLAHPNVSAVWEVLDIDGRPAVVQESLHGLAGSDWPTNASTPGVWHRLVMQSAFGIHAAHSAGLVHGRLTPDAFVLTKSGIVRVVGFGEPNWLQSRGDSTEATIADDLRDFGKTAAEWALIASRRRNAKPKPFPDCLNRILRRLGVEWEGPSAALYTSIAEMLDDLDKAAREVPADNSAWERLLHHTADNLGDGFILRRSA